jgi:hypothetical protein
MKIKSKVKAGKIVLNENQTMASRRPYQNVKSGVLVSDTNQRDVQREESATSGQRPA